MQNELPGKGRIAVVTKKVDHPRRGEGGGPKTNRGMAIARMNALKHGFAARSPVIPGMEDEDDWIAHHEGIVKSLKPVGYLEEVVVRRIATAIWQLDNYQVAVTMAHINATAFDLTVAESYLSPSKKVAQPESWKVDEAQLRRILPAEQDLNKIMRYGSHLHRQWRQDLHELEAMQARRLGQPVNLARLDISAAPRQFAPAALPALPNGLSGH